MAKKKEFKQFKVAVKADDRTVEGFASTFGNVDHQNDIVMPGAFSASIADRMPKMLWQHNTDQVIGVWDKCFETDKGLYVKGRILNTTLGNDAYELLKAGAIDTMSIGYSTVKAAYDNQAGTRKLQEVDLWEASFVTFPANDQAKVTIVKSALDDIASTVALLEQADALCDAYTDGSMQPTPEALSTIGDLIDQAMRSLAGVEEPEDDDVGTMSRDQIPSAKQLEHLLRTEGKLSKGQARRLLAEGYQTLNDRCDAGEKSELLELLNKFTLTN